MPTTSTPTTSTPTLNGGSVSASSGTSDQSSPAIVVPPQPGGEPFSHQRENLLRNPVDRPDPRLLDALENPQDRIFVVKLEKALMNFIEDKRSVIFPLPRFFFSPHFLVETTLVLTR